jgi:putative heme transporter
VGAERAVPRWLAVGSEIAVRSALLAIASLLAILALVRIRVVVLPVILAVIISSALVVPVRLMHERRVPRWLALVLTFLGFLGIIIGIFALVIMGMIGQAGDIGRAVSSAGDDIQRWLVEGPLDLDPTRVEEGRDQISRWVSEQGGRVASSAFSGVFLVVELLTGLLLTLVLTVFFVKDGHLLWGWIVRRLGSKGALAKEAGDRVTKALRRFLLGTTIDGVIEAVLVAIAFAILGVPLLVPLSLLTFLGGYLPFVGALLAGSVATLVTLATEGPTTALIVAVVYVGIQNLEGELLQPLVMGRVLSYHPVVILLVVTTGTVLGGIIGAFLAVPVLVAVTTAFGSAMDDARGVLPDPPPDLESYGEDPAPIGATEQP